ncbi:MAG: hypothetical protein ABR579_09405 [Actinomycetota bacterium]
MRHKVLWSISMAAVAAVCFSLLSPALAADAKQKKRPASGCKLIRHKKDLTCLGTAVEAWYNTETSIVPTPLPTSLGAAPPVNPYDADTLHSGIRSGQEDSRMYLTLDVASLGYTAIPEKGTLVIPIDPASSSDVKAAGLHLCFVAEPPTKSVQGSIDVPPKVDCSVDAGPKYHKKPRAYLSFDLAPFASVLAEGGLALVPTQRASTDQQTWHVETYAKKNTAKGATSIAAVVKVQKLSVPGLNSITGGGGGGPISSGGGSLGSSGTGSLIGGGSAGLPIGNSQSSGSNPIASGGETSGTAAGQTQPSAAPGALSPVAAVRYPGIWFVPLALVIGAGFFGFALTREVILRRS